jgi:hypothetical protein
VAQTVRCHSPLLWFALAVAVRVCAVLCSVPQWFPIVRV